MKARTHNLAGSQAPRAQATDCVRRLDANPVRPAGVAEAKSGDDAASGPAHDEALREASLGQRLGDMVQLTKPRITLMVLITGLGGMWLAAQSTAKPLNLGLVAWSLLGLVLAVSSANALNMFLERDVDKHMERTRNRPLPAGRMRPSTAAAFGLLLGAASLVLLLSRVNTLTAGLAGLSLMLYVGVYTPLKQRSVWAMVVGAVPGAMPPLMGWTSVSGALDAGGLALFAVLFFWQLPHFLAISTFRHKEYSRAGIKVFPDILSPARTRRHSLVYLVLLIASSLVLAPLGVVQGSFYLLMSMALGVAFFWVSARDVGVGQVQADLWARRVFVASLLYLPVLISLMVVGAS